MGQLPSGAQRDLPHMRRVRRHQRLQLIRQAWTQRMIHQIRYQIFVSSTYEDLREERQQATQAILEAGCFPSGMELFPASDDTQWELIKRVIEESDYYVVIVAGRYGSLGPEGRSYTEMEYDYAVEKGIPVLG